MKLALLSDIHLYRKPQRLRCALGAAAEAQVLLLAGDLADRAMPEQYELLLECLRELPAEMQIYCVTGNHDNPAGDDSAYRAFEERILPEPAQCHESGALYAALSPQADLIGLNPAYHQKQFFFPGRGQQLAFAEDRLAASGARVHLVMCHPPLIAHNPQRSADMPPYIVREQDDRLQRLMDASRNTLFLSGHTHYPPTVEWDEARCNLYINNGSICPTTIGGDPARLQQGNITLLTLEEDRIGVEIRGIHTSVVFHQQEYRME
jgi:predicted phosphodiesterase